MYLRRLRLTKIQHPKNMKWYRYKKKVGRPRKKITKPNQLSFAIPAGGWFPKKGLTWRQMNYYHLKEMPHTYPCSACHRQTYYIDTELGMPVCSIQCQNKLHATIPTKQNKEIRRPKGYHE